MRTAAPLAWADDCLQDLMSLSPSMAPVQGRGHPVPCAVDTAETPVLPVSMGADCPVFFVSSPSLGSSLSGVIPIVSITVSSSIDKGADRPRDVPGADWWLSRAAGPRLSRPLGRWLLGPIRGGSCVLFIMVSVVCLSVGTGRSVMVESKIHLSTLGTSVPKIQE